MFFAIETWKQGNFKTKRDLFQSPSTFKKIVLWQTILVIRYAYSRTFIESIKNQEFETGIHNWAFHIRKNKNTLPTLFSTGN